jgi:hypothetical protein
VHQPGARSKAGADDTLVWASPKLRLAVVLMVLFAGQDAAKISGYDAKGHGTC